MQTPSHHPRNSAMSVPNQDTNAQPDATPATLHMRLDGSILYGGAGWSADDLHAANVLTAIIATSSQTHPLLPRLVRLRSGNRVLAAVPADRDTAVIGRDGTEFDARASSSAIIAALGQPTGAQP